MTANMNTDDIITAPAAELADKLAAGELTSVALTQAYLDRIAAVDGDINAFVHLNADEALAAAREGADALCVQGSQAGGHRSTHRVDAIPNDLSYVDLLREVRVVLLVGRAARLGWERMGVERVPAIACPHPSPNNLAARPWALDEIRSALGAALEVARGV